MKGRKAEAGGASQLKASAIKKAVEDIYMVMLFSNRKEIACVFETVSVLYKRNADTISLASFRKAVIQELATSTTKVCTGRVQSWAHKQQVK